MKNLLNYQTCEYDCGPVSLLNGIRYLFDREEIYPDIVKFIMLYCLDTYNEHGEPCKRGTSAAAMNYIANWLNHFAETRNFPIHCEYLAGTSVVIEPGHPIYTALQDGGAVMLRLYLECAHYVLLTGLEEDRVLLFDPYYEEEEDIATDEGYHTDEIRFLDHCPKKANRSVSLQRLNSVGVEYYQMGPEKCREAIIMYHTGKKDPC
ncbi:MAG: peptidase C39 [Lachnospiraceae bacterium]|nr:peptidase C39 [Lachnospiraceae bacterium]